jgi:hypothetical protein
MNAVVSLIGTFFAGAFNFFWIAKCEIDAMQ